MLYSGFREVGQEGVELEKLLWTKEYDDFCINWSRLLWNDKLCKRIALWPFLL